MTEQADEPTPVVAWLREMKHSGHPRVPDAKEITAEMARNSAEWQKRNSLWEGHRIRQKACIALEEIAKPIRRAKPIHPKYLRHLIAAIHCGQLVITEEQRLALLCMCLGSPGRTAALTDKDQTQELLDFSDFVTQTERLETIGCWQGVSDVRKIPTNLPADRPAKGVATKPEPELSNTAQRLAKLKTKIRP